ncbi:MAG: YbgC/FadM family acyl-CoA thioesterase [Elusimicrobia bacterium]|nr:YbgC/FadM family acyl-CoA thioesterase [Elusimicrobiota bacterium]
MYKLRIYYEDTDAGEVVYYANYLKYFERARTELFRENGIELLELIKRGVHFVVSEVEAKFIVSAVLGDMLSIETKIKEIGKVSLTIEYIIKRDSTVLVTGKTKMGCINDNFKLTKIPPDVLEKLKTTMNHP